MLKLIQKLNPPLLIFFIFLIINTNCYKKKTLEITSGSFIEKELTTVFEFSSSENVLFRRVSDIKMNNQENFIVRDFFQKKLFVFNKHGAFLQSLGREGAGPGEFGLIGGFLIDGNDIIAFDRIHYKIETFSLKKGSYEHTKSQKLNSAEEYGIPLSINEALVIIKKYPTYIGGSLNHNSQIVFSKVNTSGKSDTDTLFTFPGNEPLVKRSGGLLFANKPVGVKSYFAASNDGGVFAMQSDSLSIKYFDKEGNGKAIFALSTIPVSIPSSFEDSLLSTLDEPHRSEMRKNFSKHFPLVEGLVVDSKNRIWVTLNSVAPGKGWFVFSETGKSLFHFESSASATLHSIKGDTVMWSDTNQLGEPTFFVSTFE